MQGGRMVLLDETEWDRPGPFESIMDFTRAWLGECRRVLAPNGTIWVSGTIRSLGGKGNERNINEKRNVSIGEKDGPISLFSCYREGC